VSYINTFFRNIIFYLTELTIYLSFSKNIGATCHNMWSSQVIVSIR